MLKKSKEEGNVGNPYNTSEKVLCKHCKTEIPRGAKVCPTCRKKQGGVGKWIAIGIVAFLIIGVAVGGTDGETPEKVETKAVTEKVAESPSNTKDTKFHTGETAELNDVRVTMTNFEENAGKEFVSPASGNVFALAEFEIENNTGSEISISSVLSFEAYADDYSLNYSLSAAMLKDAQLDGTVAAGKKMKGWIGWEVPEDYQNVEIHFTDDVWSDHNFVFVYDK